MSTCAQLSQQIQLLTNLIAHIHDPEAQWELIVRRNELLAQWHTQGCDRTVTRVLQGTITVWTDNSKLPPKSEPIILHLTILESTGAVSFTFDPVTVGKVTICLAPGQVGIGTLDQTTGSLFLQAPILLKNVPEAGDVSFTLSVSTGQSIQPPGQGTPLHGQPLPEGTTQGNVTLVGETQVTVLVVVTVTIWSQIVGSLG